MHHYALFRYHALLSLTILFNFSVVNEDKYQDIAHSVFNSLVLGVMLVEKRRELHLDVLHYC